MYITVQDPWGSYVDGRSIEHKELVEAFAKANGFTTKETDKEPVIDLLNSPIKAWDNARLLAPIKEVSLEEFKERFPAKPKKKANANKNK